MRKNKVLSKENSKIEIWLKRSKKKTQKDITNIQYQANLCLRSAVLNSDTRGARNRIHLQGNIIQLATSDISRVNTLKVNKYHVGGNFQS